MANLSIPDLASKISDAIRPVKIAAEEVGIDNIMSQNVGQILRLVSFEDFALEKSIFNLSTQNIISNFGVVHSPFSTRFSGLLICGTQPESLHDVPDRVVISFDHSSHARKTQVKIYRHEWGQKVEGHYKIQSCTQKTNKFPGIE